MARVSETGDEERLNWMRGLTFKYCGIDEHIILRMAGGCKLLGSQTKVSAPFPKRMQQAKGH